MAHDRRGVILEHEDAKAVAEHEALDAHRGSEGDGGVVSDKGEPFLAPVELVEQVGVSAPSSAGGGSDGVGRHGRML
jgi:hypothetical protein